MVLQYIKEMSIDDFEFLSVLGKGSYSWVYKVRRNDNNKVYALK